MLTVYSTEVLWVFEIFFLIIILNKNKNNTSYYNKLVILLNKVQFFFIYLFLSQAAKAINLFVDLCGSGRGWNYRFLTRVFVWKNFDRTPAGLRHDRSWESAWRKVSSLTKIQIAEDTRRNLRLSPLGYSISISILSIQLEKNVAYD